MYERISLTVIKSVTLQIISPCIYIARFVAQKPEISIRIRPLIYGHSIWQSLVSEIILVILIGQLPPLN